MSAVDRDALTVAMTVAPGVYARNRMFAFYKDPAVRWARARAALLRGVVRQLAGGLGEPQEVSFSRRGKGSVLRYRIARMHLERTVELTELEAACVAYLGGRARIAGLEATAEDRALLDSALRRLANGIELRMLESARE